MLKSWFHDQSRDFMIRSHDIMKHKMTFHLWFWQQFFFPCRDHSKLDKAINCGTPDERANLCGREWHAKTRTNSVIGIPLHATWLHGGARCLRCGSRFDVWLSRVNVPYAWKSCRYFASGYSKQPELPAVLRHKCVRYSTAQPVQFDDIRISNYTYIVEMLTNSIRWRWLSIVHLTGTECIIQMCIRGLSQSIQFPEQSPKWTAFGAAMRWGWVPYCSHGRRSQMTPSLVLCYEDRYIFFKEDSQQLLEKIHPFFPWIILSKSSKSRSFFWKYALNISMNFPCRWYNEIKPVSNQTIWNNSEEEVIWRFLQKIHSFRVQWTIPSRNAFISLDQNIETDNKAKNIAITFLITTL